MGPKWIGRKVGLPTYTMIYSLGTNLKMKRATKIVDVTTSLGVQPMSRQQNAYKLYKVFEARCFFYRDMKNKITNSSSVWIFLSEIVGICYEIHCFMQLFMQPGPTKVQGHTFPLYESENRRPYKASIYFYFLSWIYSNKFNNDQWTLYSIF